MACIALCVKEARKSTSSRIHTPFPCLQRLSRRFLLFLSNVWVSVPNLASSLRGTQPPQPSSSSFENMQSYSRRLAGLAASLWNQFLELRRSWRGGGSFWGGQNVSPSPFYTPLLFGTELPKADGCADSLQIRADLRSSQRANQKQLSSAGVREGLCCPLLAPQESTDGIYFIRFIFTHYFFGHIREGRRRARSELRFRWGIGTLVKIQTTALWQILDLKSQQNFIALGSDLPITTWVGQNFIWAILNL